MIVVIGIGADGMPGLSRDSRHELRRARMVYGSSRQLDLLDDTVTAVRRQWPSPLVPALPGLLDSRSDVHVLASGDPLLHGIGGTLIGLFGSRQVSVRPHLSAVTLACARMGWTGADTEVINVVNAPIHTAVRRGGRAIVLSRDAATPTALARMLADHGRGASTLGVLETLGGPGERRRDGSADEWAAGRADDVDNLNVVAVEYLPDERISATLPDTAFAHDGQLTKQNLRAATLAALAPRPGQRLWDVGAGSGSVAVEWARSGPGCSAVAFERDGTRRGRIAANAAAFGAAVDVRGAAPEALAGVAAPSAVFIGGGLTQPGVLDTCLQAVDGGGRLVANAVTVESEAALTGAHSQFGGVLRRFQHYRGEPVGRFTGWRPQLPVTQWSVSL